LVRVFFIAPHCSLPCRALSQHVRCRTGFLLADASVAEQAFCLQISSTLLLVLTHAPRHVTQTLHRGTYVETNRQHDGDCIGLVFGIGLLQVCTYCGCFLLVGERGDVSPLSKIHFSGPIQWARGDVGLKTPPPPHAPRGCFLWVGALCVCRFSRSPSRMHRPSHHCALCLLTPYCTQQPASQRGHDDRSRSVNIHRDML